MIASHMDSEKVVCLGVCNNAQVGVGGLPYGLVK